MSKPKTSKFKSKLSQSFSDKDKLGIRAALELMKNSLVFPKKLLKLSNTSLDLRSSTTHL